MDRLRDCRSSISMAPDAIDAHGTSRTRVARVLLFLFGWLLLSIFVTTPSLAELKTERLTITTASGQHDFVVEMAETEAQKAMGLMFRQSLPKRGGMLFAYDRAPFEITMWMRNTYISLDMIFLRKDGRVHRIERGTEPFSERVVASQGNVSAVLEVAAGVADEIDLKPGDRVAHRFFKAK